ncbi:Tic22 family protein [uncultured Thermosynechococcus sp.]|uniref:Tic22 family protein n=1 Tax=uncultured Thermosynechococcus sp. TaxID=436945 RepID=UPI00261DE413|nr:Tic22 family protein [uncultured Thermosynechococcus sp.]
MKRLAHLGVLAGLVSSLWLAPALSRHDIATALPEEQVLRILSNVPIFMITNDKGEPLTVEIPNPKDRNKKIQVFTFFVNQQDAQTALNGIKTQQPEVGRVARVSAAALSGAVKIALESQKNPAIGVDIVPSKPQLEAAVNLLKQSGDLVERDGKILTKDGQPFMGGTPLFFLADSKTGNPIAIEAQMRENGQTRTQRFIPFYFDKAQLQREVDQARQQRPELAKDTGIRVVMLDNLVTTMLSTNDPVAGQIQLVQTPEAIQFALQQSGGNNAQRPSPANQPAAPQRPNQQGGGTGSNQGTNRKR